MKIIRYIPKKEEKNGKLKVVAYCRVSTKEKHQKESLNYQIEYYTNLIKNNPKYIFVDVFYDYESGLRIKGRAGLEKMLKLAYEERIDKKHCLLIDRNYAISSNKKLCSEVAQKL